MTGPRKKDSGPINKVAKGIVLFPCVVLGGMFLTAGLSGNAGANESLALGLGSALLGGGILTQLIPDDVWAKANQPDNDGV
eukprot:g50336.t1